MTGRAGASPGAADAAASDAVMVLALVCDREGTVLRIVRDDLGLVARTGGASLRSLVDGGSADKARHLIETARERGAVTDWHLCVPHDGRTESLHCAAGTIDDERILVVGVTSHDQVDRLYGEMMRINNEQANAIRAAVKEQAMQQRERPAGDDALYEELMRVNNELTTVQRELARKNAELQRLNDQKSQFVGMAAHDLRNPLNVIRGWSDFLLQDGANLPREKWTEFLGRIRDSSDFMLRLINELLDISAIESGRLRLTVAPTDVVELVRRNVSLNRMLAKDKGIDIVLDAGEEPIEAEVDAEKIQQVLDNLLSNAAKFSPADSRVWVHAAREGDEVVVSVRDSGPGIPQEEQGKLFKPFGRTSVRGTRGERSTGLGLAIVKRIVDGHHGRIWFESVQGRGATFHVALPLRFRAPNRA